MVVTAHQGDTMDLLCWRHLGVTDGATEQALALNRHVDALAVVIPPGTPVTLPDIETTTIATREIVNLWS